MKINNIILECNNNIDKYNILTFPTHERYETQLCKTGHNFYSLNFSNQPKYWNKSQTSVPTNYFILPKDLICEYLNYDFILVQSKFWQFELARKINNILNVPIIVLEHTLPTSKQQAVFRNLLGDINIFISNFSKNAWGIDKNSFVIKHSVDTKTFNNYEQERDNKILTVANDFINRDYCLNFGGWKRVTANLPVTLVGDTEGLSSAANSIDELVNIYNNHSIYFNSSTLSPIPCSLLEAMACGCAVVSTATCMIPEIIENGVNGFISNDENELRQFLENLLLDQELARKIGNNARNTIITKFTEEKFIHNWNRMFKLIKDRK